MLKFNIEEKLDTTVQALNGLRVVKHTPLRVLYKSAVANESLPKNRDGFTEFSAPYFLFEQEKYIWFVGDFEVSATNNQKAYLCVETFIHGVASTIRPQGLLYIDGKIAQAIDINHTHVLVENGKHTFALLFYTHVFGLSLPVYFSIKVEDNLTTALYYDFAVARDSVKLLLEKTDDYQKSITILEQATNLLDFRYPHTQIYYDSLQTAHNYLLDNYYVGSSNKPIVNCIGSSHIDVAWLWDLEQTQQKVERTASTVLKLMEEYPEYKFMSSQAVLLYFLKQRNPQLYKQVQQRVKEGRWEVDGAFWLQTDCNLTSGESLVRQVAHGKRFFKEEFGKDCDTVWEPDVFGYSANLPQIMQKSGLTRFVTAKIGWNDTNRMPYDAFLWQGIDGSQVFAYFLSTCECDPRNGVYDKTYTTYTGPIDAPAVLGTWHRFQQKEYSDTTILSYGWGDGGGGPTREDFEMQRRLERGVLGIPATRMARLDETLDDIQRQFESNCKALKRTPKWCGELYFEYHRGTLTSVPRIKYNNRKGEFALQNAELLSVLASKNGFEYPCQQLDQNWKKLLLNQFHDILPGSAIEKVYLDSDEQFRQLFAQVGEITNDAIFAIGKNIGTKGGALVFNPNGFTATALVQVDGVSHIAKDIPPLGYAVVEPACSCNVKVGRRSLENDVFVLEFADDGAIVSILDKRVNRQIVPSGAKLNQFVAYEDMPYQYDNWELTPYHTQNKWVLDDTATFTKIIDGTRAGFEIVKHYGDSTITQKVFLMDGVYRIDFVTNVDWKEKKQLLKVIFPLDLLVNKATYDIQFGSIERSTHKNTSWDSARFECAGQKWVDMSENNYGVALLNDCKYGFGAEENLLSMTVVKSGSFPYDGASDVIPQFVYSIYPHQGNFTTGKVIEQAYLLNRPLIATKVSEQQGSFPDNFSLVSCDVNGVFVETVKQADDGNGVILRMYEGYKERKTVTLTINRPFEKAYLCDLLENEQGELKAENSKVSFEIKPFEIVTVKLV